MGVKGNLQEKNGIDVCIMDSELQRRERANREYMYHLENRFLLMNFNLEAGRDTSAYRASESCQGAVSSRQGRYGGFFIWSGSPCRDM